MGAEVSSLQGGPSKDLISFLSGEIMEGDRVSNLLAFKVRSPTSEEEGESMLGYCRKIKENTEQDMFHNLSTLVGLVSHTNLSTETSQEDLCILHNGLFFIKWLLLTYPEHGGEMKGLKLIDMVLTVITSIEVRDATYHLVTEATDILRLLPSPCLTSQEVQLVTLVTTLLANIIQQKHAPVFPFGRPSSIGRSLASGLWSVVTVGLGSLEETADPSYQPLPASSCSLLLHMISTTPEVLTTLARLKDGEQVNFSDLHYVLLARPGATPLVKALLSCNAEFRRFVILGTDLSLLLGPVLKQIYEQGTETRIVEEGLDMLYVLASDEVFNQAVHSSNRPGSFNWYQERSLKTIKVGGVICLVLLRAAQQQDMQQHRARCLDILLHMSAHIRLMDFYLAERMVSSLEIQLRRLSKQERGGVVDNLAKDLIIIINNVVVQQTEHNPNLLYSLLYKRDSLVSCLEQLPAMKHFFVNIGSVLEMLGEEVRKVEELGTTEEVLNIIRQAAINIPPGIIIDVNTEIITNQVSNSEENLVSLSDKLDALELNVENYSNAEQAAGDIVRTLNEKTLDGPERPQNDGEKTTLNDAAIGEEEKAVEVTRDNDKILDNHEQNLSEKITDIDENENIPITAKDVNIMDEEISVEESRGAWEIKHVEKPTDVQETRTVIEGNDLEAATQVAEKKTDTEEMEIENVDGMNIVEEITDIETIQNVQNTTNDEKIKTGEETTEVEEVRTVGDTKIDKMKNNIDVTTDIGETEVVEEMSYVEGVKTVEETTYVEKMNTVETRDIKEMKTEETQDVKEMKTGETQDIKEMKTVETKDIKEMKTVETRDIKEMKTEETQDKKEMKTGETQDIKEMKTVETEDIKEMKTEDTQDIKKIKTVETQDTKEMITVETQDIKEMKTEETQDIKEMKTEETQDIKEMKTEETQDIKEMKTEETQDIKEMKTVETQDIREMKTVETQDIKEMKTEETQDIKEMKTEETQDIKELKTVETQDIKNIKTLETRDIKEMKTVEITTDIEELKSVDTSDTKEHSTLEETTDIEGMRTSGEMEIVRESPVDDHVEAVELIADIREGGVVEDVSVVEEVEIVEEETDIEKETDIEEMKMDIEEMKTVEEKRGIEGMITLDAEDKTVQVTTDVENMKTNEDTQVVEEMQIAMEAHAVDDKNIVVGEIKTVDETTIFGELTTEINTDASPDVWTQSIIEKTAVTINVDLSKQVTEGMLLKDGTECEHKQIIDVTTSNEVTYDLLKEKVARCNSLEPSHVESIEFISSYFNTNKSIIFVLDTNMLQNVELDDKTKIHIKDFEIVSNETFMDYSGHQSGDSAIEKPDDTIIEEVIVVEGVNILEEITIDDEMESSAKTPVVEDINIVKEKNNGNTVVVEKIKTVEDSTDAKETTNVEETIDVKKTNDVAEAKTVENTIVEGMKMEEKTKDVEKTNIVEETLEKTTNNEEMKTIEVTIDVEKTNTVEEATNDEEMKTVKETKDVEKTNNVEETNTVEGTTNDEEINISKEAKDVQVAINVEETPNDEEMKTVEDTKDIDKTNYVEQPETLKETTNDEETPTDGMTKTVGNTTDVGKVKTGKIIAIIEKIKSVEEIPTDENITTIENTTDIVEAKTLEKTPTDKQIQTFENTTDVEVFNTGEETTNAEDMKTEEETTINEEMKAVEETRYNETMDILEGPAEEKPYMEETLPANNEECEGSVAIEEPIVGLKTNCAADKETVNISFDIEKDVYEEFAKQQRLINFESTHQKKNSTKSQEAQSSPRQDPQVLTTNLCLNGYTIKFDVYGRSDQIKPKYANIIWDRASKV